MSVQQPCKCADSCICRIHVLQTTHPTKSSPSQETHRNGILFISTVIGTRTEQHLTTNQLGWKRQGKNKQGLFLTFLNQHLQMSSWTFQPIPRPINFILVWSFVSLQCQILNKWFDWRGFRLQETGLIISGTCLASSLDFWAIFCSTSINASTWLLVLSLTAAQAFYSLCSKKILLVEENARC